MIGNRTAVGLSATALIVAVLGSTTAGRAALDAVVPVPLAKRAYLADTAKNAVRLNNIKASTTPTPGMLVPLDSGGKLPASIGAVGPQGARGKDGKSGKDGTDGKSATSLWAKVNGREIVASSGKPTFNHRGTGSWQLTFGEKVENCAILANISLQKPEIDISAVAGGGNTVNVQTFNASYPWNGVDVPFTVAALC